MFWFQTFFSKLELHVLISNFRACAKWHLSSFLSAMMKISWHKYYVDISSDPWADNSDLHTVEKEINLRCILTKFVILNFFEIFYSEKPILTGIIYPTFIELNWPQTEKFGGLNHSYLFHILQNICSFTITMEVRFMAWMDDLKVSFKKSWNLNYDISLYFFERSCVHGRIQE